MRDPAAVVAGAVERAGKRSGDVFCSVREGKCTGEPVRELRVKSLMVPPGIPDWYTRQRIVEAGPVALQGRAWSGNGAKIAKVEVGVDGIWHEATLRSRKDTYAWTGWDFDWEATVGQHVLSCRATDENGEIQPTDARWDNSGLGNNGAQHVHVTVR